MSGAGDRFIVVVQLTLGFLLVVFGACLVAFAGLSDKSSVAIAVIGVGAAVLPSGAAASASARILQSLPSSSAPELLDLQLDSDTVAAGSTVSAAVLLSASAEPGGFTVELTVEPAEHAQCPPSVTVPAGAAIAPFAITALPAGVGHTVTVTASTAAQKEQRTFKVT